MYGANREQHSQIWTLFYVANIQTLTKSLSSLCLHFFPLHFSVYNFIVCIFFINHVFCLSRNRRECTASVLCECILVMRSNPPGSRKNIFFLFVGEDVMNRMIRGYLIRNWVTMKINSNFTTEKAVHQIKKR